MYKFNDKITLPVIIEDEFEKSKKTILIAFVLQQCDSITAGVFKVKCTVDNQWVFIVTTLLIGLSFAFPLFLYARETHKESQES